MTTPTTLADWAAHCRAQAAAWDRVSPLIRDHSADWRALALLCEYVSTRDAMSNAVWPQQLALAVARIAAHLPTTTDGSTR